MIVTGGRKSVKSRLKDRSSYKKSAKSNPKMSKIRGEMERMKERTGYKDNGSSGSPVTLEFSTTGSIVLIADAISQGSSVNQRKGKFVNWKSLQVKGWIKPNATTTYSKVAYLVVYDKQPGTALPAISDILDTIHPNSLNKDAASQRFRVLKRVDSTVVNSNSSDRYVHDVDFFLDLKGKKCEFRALGTGEIADIGYGALYFVAVGDQVTGGTLPPTGSLVMRTRFYDF